MISILKNKFLYLFLATLPIISIVGFRLYNPSPELVLMADPSMKITTSICFLILILSSYLTINNRTGERIDIFLFMAPMIKLFIIGFGFAFLDENIDEAAFTYSSMTPSWGTTILFTMFCFTQTAYIYNPNRQDIFYYCGIASMTTALIALIGYIFNLPYLYWYIDKISTGLAIKTAFMFFVLGFIFINIPRALNQETQD